MNDVRWSIVLLWVLQRWKSVKRSFERFSNVHLLIMSVHYRKDFWNCHKSNEMRWIQENQPFLTYSSVDKYICIFDGNSSYEIQISYENNRSHSFINAEINWKSIHFELFKEFDANPTILPYLFISSISFLLVPWKE